MIETKRLRLRPFHVGDLMDYTAIWAKPEVVRYLPSEADTARAAETAAAFIRDWGKPAWGPSYWPWAVEDRLDGRLIGHCGLRFSASLEAAELVYLFDSTVWGSGYASESARAACDFGREKLGLNYIAAVALADNAGSIAVLRRTGFLHEGDFTSDGYRLVRYGLTA